MKPAMNPLAVALGAGLQRAWVEFRQTVSSLQEIWGAAFFPAMGLLVMFLLRGNTVPGTSFSLGSQAVPGILGMNIAFTGLMWLAMALTMDREDGTLLRAKAAPNGMLGLLTGRVVGRASVTILSTIIILIPGALLFDGLELRPLQLVWVLTLGLLATLPIGAMLGALFSNVQNLSFLSLFIMGLVAISGIFYPITAMPQWLQWVGQAFPIYWLGLGMRAGMLPDSMAAVEIGESWRHLETTGVLGAWAILGFVLAPPLLRRMARRESGSAVEARRRKAMQRYG